MKNVPKTWKAAWSILLMSSTNHFKTLESISSIAGCSKTAIRAFRELGYIKKDSSGFFRIVPGTIPDWSKVRALFDSLYEKPISKKLPSVTPQELFTPVAETQPQNSAERTYTKAQVIEAFKAFYIREYDKMDDRSYTLIGFLLESLNDVL